ncbi:MAG: aminomethyl-transferring glycine dehydrogenase subunit GcvPA [Deltaproteobacteria bacterium]|nr:aminomethyl-transferring glycine dehydrogenase subunit GcvPA [Deltaproteobacteria bacterium]
MRYLPHTPDEIRAMLGTIGAASIDALFEPIPEEVRLGRPLGLEPALDEARLMQHLEQLAAKNDAARALSFLGAGIYDHHVPPAVDQLLLRSEFYTAYTPYQPEVSQGTLQAIFEFQTIVAELFGMDVANASMYDGASATAEAVLMARRLTGRDAVVLSAGVHPEYRAVTRTYSRGNVPPEAVRDVAIGPDGRTDLDALEAAIDQHTCAVVVGYPSFFGAVEPIARIAEIAHRKGALLITATAEPYALALVEAPGIAGADIAVGEGQALAVPPQYGGPGVGLFATRTAHVHKMPGRLVGQTVDLEGKRAFTLTLSTREQHIRREKATSNICTNHSLIALALAIRVSLLGKVGFEAVARLCLSKTEYLKKRIAELPGYTLPFAAPTFNEIVVRREAGKAGPLLAALAARGILAGVDLGTFDPALDNCFLVAVTERHAKDDLDRLVEGLRAA